MTERKPVRLFDIPGVFPALVADVTGVVVGVILLVVGQPILGVAAIVLGSLPLLFVLMRFAAERKRNGGGQP